VIKKIMLAILGIALFLGVWLGPPRVIQVEGRDYYRDPVRALQSRYAAFRESQKNAVKTTARAYFSSQGDLFLDSLRDYTGYQIPASRTVQNAVEAFYRSTGEECSRCAAEIKSHEAAFVLPWQKTGGETTAADLFPAPEVFIINGNTYSPEAYEAFAEITGTLKAAVAALRIEKIAGEYREAGELIAANLKEQQDIAGGIHPLIIKNRTDYLARQAEFANVLLEWFLASCLVPNTGTARGEAAVQELDAPLSLPFVELDGKKYDSDALRALDECLATLRSQWEVLVPAAYGELVSGQFDSIKKTIEERKPLRVSAFPPVLPEARRYFESQSRKSAGLFAELLETCESLEIPVYGKMVPAPPVDTSALVLPAAERDIKQYDGFALRALYSLLDPVRNEWDTFLSVEDGYIAALVEKQYADLENNIAKNSGLKNIMNAWDVSGEIKYLEMIAGFSGKYFTALLDQCGIPRAAREIRPGAEFPDFSALKINAILIGGKPHHPGGIKAAAGAREKLNNAWEGLMLDSYRQSMAHQKAEIDRLFAPEGIGGEIKLADDLAEKTAYYSGVSAESEKLFRETIDQCAVAAEHVTAAETVEIKPEPLRIRTLEIYGNKYNQIAFELVQAYIGDLRLKWDARLAEADKQIGDHIRAQYRAMYTKARNGTDITHGPRREALFGIIGPLTEIPRLLSGYFAALYKDILTDPEFQINTSGIDIVPDASDLTMDAVLVDDLPYYSPAVLELHSMIQEHKNLYINGLRNKLLEIINSQSDLCVMNVDSYLDWYYSIGKQFGDLGTTVKMVFGNREAMYNRMMENYVKHVGNGVTLTESLEESLVQWSNHVSDFSLNVLYSLESAMIPDGVPLEIEGAINGNDLMLEFVPVLDYIQKSAAGLENLGAVSFEDTMGKSSRIMDVAGYFTTGLSFIPGPVGTIGDVLDTMISIFGIKLEEALKRGEFREKLVNAINQSRKDMISAVTLGE
jgi:hypothetical protein